MMGIKTIILGIVGIYGPMVPNGPLCAGGFLLQLVIVLVYLYFGKTQNNEKKRKEKHFGHSDPPA